ncbi:MAG: serine/threonine protein kinase, partial [Smithella sp.]
AVSPDGRKLYSGSDDGMIKIWDVVSGEHIAELEGHSSGVMSLAVSSDGQRLYSGSYNGIIKIWNAVSGECIAELERHSSGVMSLAVSPDGRRLFSGSDDGVIRLFDTISLNELMPVINNGEKDWSVVDYENNRVIQCGPEAWRRLAWVGLDDQGRITSYPIEMEGPLPIKEES